MTIRSTWRALPTAATRVDDGAVNWIAFSPLIVVAAWIVLWSWGFPAGPSVVVPATGLLILDAVLAAVDRLRMRGKHLWGLPSVLWGLATPFVYLPMRRRALARNGLEASWAPLAIYCGCLGLLLAICLVWVVLRAMTFGVGG